MMADDGPTNCASCAKPETGLAEGATLLRCSRCKTVRYCSRECQSNAWKEHKKTCVPPFATNHDSPTSRKRIVLITLEDYSWLGDMYDSFFTPMRARCDFLEVKKISAAINSIATTPAAVIVFEPSIMKQSDDDKYRGLNNTLKAYVEVGGTVIFGCQCSSHVTPLDVEWYFPNIWTLAWKTGNYSRQDCVPNPDLREINGKALPKTYNVKALQLDRVQDDAIVYRQEGAAPRRGAAVVWEPHGSSEGHLAWLGDVNNEEGTRNIMMMMCGLWHRLGA